MKLAGSSWRTSANTLQSSALALCYSTAEYCTPVWSCSADTSQVDVQLNSTMRLISGTLRPHLSHGFQCSPTLNCQPYKKVCHYWQAGGENCQTWQLANPAWYTQPIIATTDIEEATVAVSHCRILSSDEAEWWLILATLCRWRWCFLADQLIIIMIIMIIRIIIK